MLPSLRVPSASSINKFFFCSFFWCVTKGTAESQWAVAVAHWSFPGQINFEFRISSLEILIVIFQTQNPENPKSNIELTGQCRGSEGGQIGYRGGRRDS